MIRSETSHSVAPIANKCLEKKQDAPDDFGLLLQMFAQPFVGESGYDERSEVAEKVAKPLLFVETAEMFSKVFAQPSSGISAANAEAEQPHDLKIDVGHNLKASPDPEQMSKPESGIKTEQQTALTHPKQGFVADNMTVTLSATVPNKGLLFKSFVPLTTLNDHNQMSMVRFSHVHTMHDEAGSSQQVVEWGSLAAGYLSYLTSVKTPVVFADISSVAPGKSGQAKAGQNDIATAGINRSSPAHSFNLEFSKIQANEALYIESPEMIEIFDLENSIATEQMAATWHAYEVTREYLNILNDESGGLRLYYRNYFEANQTQATTALFELLNSDIYSNLSDAKINGQIVHRGENNGR